MKINHAAIADRAWSVLRFALVCIGIIATADGLFGIVGSGLPFYGALAFALTFAAAVEVGYARSLSMARRGAGAHHIVTAVTCGLIAVMFATSFWFRVMRGESITLTELVVKTNTVTTAVTTAVTRTAALGTALDAATAYSVTAADRERRVGDSCGQQTKAVIGPRYALRESDAAMFRDYQQRTRALFERLTKARDRIPNVSVGREAVMDGLNAVLAEVSGLLSDPMLAAMRKDFEERQRKGQGSIQSPRGTYTCPDDTLARHIRQVVAQIDGLPTLPSTIIVENASDVRHATAALVERIWSNKLALADMTAIGWGALLHLVIAMLTFAGEPSDFSHFFRRMREARRRAAENGGTLLDPWIEEEKAQALLAVMKRCYWWGSAIYLIVPVNGACPKAWQMPCLAIELERHRVAHPATLWRLKAKARRVWADALPANGRLSAADFRAYRLRKDWLAAEIDWARFAPTANATSTAGWTHSTSWQWRSSDRMALPSPANDSHPRDKAA